MTNPKFLNQPNRWDASELRAELARRGWSGKDLADHTGLSRSYVTWILRGAIPHRKKALSTLFRVFGPEAWGRITGELIPTRSTGPRG